MRKHLGVPVGMIITRNDNTKVSPILAKKILIWPELWLNIILYIAPLGQSFGTFVPYMLPIGTFVPYLQPTEAIIPYKQTTMLSASLRVLFKISSLGHRTIKYT